jgi:hypothetical protein
MRTFCAIICAAVAGLMLFGAAWALMNHDGKGAMLAGLIGCSALMSAALAFRRPTETERHEQEAKRAARANLKAAKLRLVLWNSTASIALIIVAVTVSLATIQYVDQTTESTTSAPLLTGKIRTSVVDAVTALQNRLGMVPDDKTSPSASQVKEPNASDGQTEAWEPATTVVEQAKCDGAQPGTEAYVQCRMTLEDAKCRSYGAQPGTEAYSQCRTTINNNRALRELEEQNARTEAAVRQWTSR